MYYIHICNDMSHLAKYALTLQC